MSLKFYSFFFSKIKKINFLYFAKILFFWISIGIFLMLSYVYFNKINTFITYGTRSKPVRTKQINKIALINNYSAFTIRELKSKI